MLLLKQGYLVVVTGGDVKREELKKVAMVQKRRALQPKRLRGIKYIQDLC